jgi:beta-fructofuranosidase
MLYTGTSTAERGAIQRIGLATSADLRSWSRHPGNPVIQSDGRWYEQLDPTVWPHEAWRDPWVFADEAGTGWHALITARGRSGLSSQRGVIGHAQSTDLVNWTVGPPLTSPGRFHHLEVPQATRIGDRWYLLFSVDHEEGGRTYACSAGSPLGPFDVAGATPLGSPLLYSGRVVKARDGQPRLLAFLNSREDGTFVGELSDPIALDIDRKGRLITNGRR